MNSPILSNITKTLTGLKSIASKTLESSKTLGKIVENNIVNKKRTISRSSILARRRAEATKRKDREDLLEASGVRGVVRKTKNAVVRSTKGFLGRIMDFLATLLIGWGLVNLPKIIKFAEDLIKRMQTFFGRMNQIVTGIFGIMSGFGKLLGAVFSGLLSFNFAAEKPRFESAFQQINLGIDNLTNRTQIELNKEISLHNDFMNEVEKEDVKLRQQLAPEDPNTQTQTQTESQTGNAGGTAPTSAADQSGGLGTPDTPPSQPSSSAPSAPSVSGAATLFSVISRGEGGVNSVNRGNAGDTPGGAKSIFGKNLTDMTVSEIYNAQQSGQVFAVGKYQIIDITMPGFISYLKRKGIDPDTTRFTEGVQDYFKSYVINEKRPIVGKYLRGETDNKVEAAQALAREFASIGLSYPEAGRQKGQSRYAGTGNNAASISPEEIQSALERSRSKRSTKTNQSNLQSNNTGNRSSNIAQSLSPSPIRRSNLAGGKPKPKTQLIATNNTVTKLVPVPVGNRNSGGAAARVNSDGATLPDIQLTSLTA